jgi:hypothetical protein
MTPDGKPSLNAALPASARKMDPTIRFLRHIARVVKKWAG